VHPILFKIGPITIFTYGATIAVSFLVCSFLIWRNAPLVGISRKKMLDFAIVILISGIIGARFLHVVLNLDYYKGNLFEIFLITRGGLAFQGAIIFSFVSGIIFSKINSIPIWQAGDLIAPYAALGQAIGRIGCYLNGCCYGKGILVPQFGVIFPGDNITRLPVQLYAALVLLFIYCILRFMLEKRIFRDSLILLYFMMFSFQRFFLDFLRADLKVSYFSLTVSQNISIVVFFLSLAVFTWKRFNGGHAKI